MCSSKRLVDYVTALGRFLGQQVLLGHITKLVGDHPFCFKEVGRAGGEQGWELGNPAPRMDMVGNLAIWPAR